MSIASALLASLLAAGTPADPDGRPATVRVDIPPRDLPAAMARLAGGELDESRPGIALLGGGCDLGTPIFTSAGLPPEGDVPSAVRFTPDGAKIVIAHRDSRNLVVHDASTFATLVTIQLSGGPVDMDLSPDGTKAITANTFENTASLVDLVGGAEIAAIDVGDQPGVARFAPGGATAVIGNTVTADLSVIDVGSASEIGRIPGTEFVLTLSFNVESGQWTLQYGTTEVADATTAVHADYFNAEVDVVELDTGVVTSIPTAANPRDIAFDPTRTRAYVAHTGSARTITVIDVPSRTIVDTIAMPEDLWGSIAVNPSETHAIVSVLNACRRVDLVTHAVDSTISTASVNDLLTTADGLYALGVGFNGSLMSYATGSLVKNLNTVVSTAIGAVSPVAAKAAMCANVFGEDLLVVTTNGAAGALVHRGSSGAPPEGDRMRMIAVTADGTRAVASGIFSDTVQVIDAQTGATLHVVPVGDRPSEVAITPDGTKAVVANLDSTYASIVTLATGAVTNVPISTRGSVVEISPDGVYAYVAVVSGGDGVWRIKISSGGVTGPKLLTTNMGAVGYLYWQPSGMTLSHDGSILAVCGSFDDKVTFIDAVNWAVLGNADVFALPTKAIFSSDDSTLYVACRDANSVVKVNVPTRTPVDAFTTGDQPWSMALSPDDSVLYVLDYGARTVRRILTASGTTTHTHALADITSDFRLSLDGSCLMVASGRASVTVGSGGSFIDNAGTITVLDAATLAPLSETDVAYLPAMLAQSADGSRLVMPQPSADGITSIALGGAACPSDLDGSGAVDFGDVLAILSAWGPCGGCPEDLDASGAVDFADLLAVLSAWGPC